ncbi:MAG: LysR family transcriptional regulator [Gammaproteobacteria bacterium]|nr:LysR family transcriptional regulator [Gammaproteobacteria bacterium]
MITLNQLANALALQEHGSFRRAAVAQHLSQPAFSRSIQNLEASLGVTLFDRQTSGIKPTIYGKALLRRADTMLIEAHEIERETRLLKQFDIGSISIAMGIIAAETSGCRAVAELVRLHPDLHCQVRVENWRNIENMVLDRRVDIGLAGIYYKEENKQLQMDPVADHDFVFFCRCGHPLLELENLSKSDLDAYPVATSHLPPEMAAVFPGKTSLDKKSGDLTPSINAEDQTAARVIVAGSNAFSAATPVQIEPWLKSGEFKVLNFQQPWMKVRYGFIYRRDRMLAPAAEAFMQHVCEIETEVTQRNQDLIKHYFPVLMEA